MQFNHTIGIQRMLLFIHLYATTKIMGHLLHTCSVVISENTDHETIAVHLFKSLLNFSLAHLEGQERYITFLMVVLPNIKIGRILLIFVIVQKILMFKLSGTFLPHHLAKLQPLVWLVL